MESRINPSRDDENGSIEKRLDKLAEDIKKLPPNRVDTLERLIHALTKREEETPKTQKKTFSIKETAEIIGVSRDTIRRAIQSGALKAVQFKKHGNWFITIEEVERFLRGET